MIDCWLFTGRIFGPFLFLFIFSHGFGQELQSFFPPTASAGEWKMVDSVRIISGDDLYGLIDGGAELYIEYGFTRVAAAKYENASHSKLQAEIYGMCSDSAAYGFFTTMQSPSSKPLSIGQQGLLFSYYLVFWKGAYFVTITGSGSDEKDKKAMVELASFIDKHITVTGAIPSWVSLLPEDQLVQKKFVKGNIGLSNIYSFGPGNIFSVKEAVCGIYPKSTLFVFKYENPIQAMEIGTAAIDKLTQSPLFKAGKKRGQSFQATDGKKNQLVVEISGQYIIAYISTDSKEYQRLKALLELKLNLSTR